MNKKIDIAISSTADVSGFSKVENGVKRLSFSVSSLDVVVKKAGEAFGGLGGTAMAGLAELLKGGVWAVVGEGVKFIISLFKNCREEAKKAEEAAVKAFDREVRKFGELQADIEKSHAAANAAADARLKKIKEETDAVNDLRKAELELERERLRAAGDAKGAESIGERMAGLDAEAAAAKMQAEIRAAEIRIAEARENLDKHSRRDPEARVYADKAAAKYRDAESEVRRKAEEDAVGDHEIVSTVYGTNVFYHKATDEQRRAAGEKAVEEWLKSDEGTRLAESRKSAENALKSASEARAKAAQELDAAQSALANLERRADALALREEARAARAENDAAERSAESARKTAEETRKAEEKAAQDAARERDRLDRKLHQSRAAACSAILRGLSAGSPCLVPGARSASMRRRFSPGSLTE